MDYLSLTNRVLKALNEVPLTSINFASATGFHADAQDSVNRAIFDIYTEEDTEWPFAWSKININTVIGQTEYTMDAALVSIDWDSFFIRKTTTPYDQRKLWQLDYDEYREFYSSNDFNNDPTGYSYPQRVVRTPQNNFIVTPVPDAIYTMTYEGFSMPSVLNMYSDVPSIPAPFEQVIVDKALHYAYMFRDNMEQASMAQDRYEKNVNKMRRILIPQITFARASE